jgi:hypothetical protein
MAARSAPKIGDVKAGGGSSVGRLDGGRAARVFIASGSTTVRESWGEAYAKLDATLQPLAAAADTLPKGMPRRADSGGHRRRQQGSSGSGHG